MLYYFFTLKKKKLTIRYEIFFPSIRKIIPDSLISFFRSSVVILMKQGLCSLNRSILAPLIGKHSASYTELDRLCEEDPSSESISLWNHCVLWCDLTFYLKTSFADCQETAVARSLFKQHNQLHSQPDVSPAGPLPLHHLIQVQWLFQQTEAWLCHGLFSGQQHQVHEGGCKRQHAVFFYTILFLGRKSQHWGLPETYTHHLTRTQTRCH